MAKYMVMGQTYSQNIGHSISKAEAQHFALGNFTPQQIDTHYQKIADATSPQPQETPPPGNDNSPVQTKP